MRCLGMRSPDSRARFDVILISSQFDRHWHVVGGERVWDVMGLCTGDK